MLFIPFFPFLISKLTIKMFCLTCSTTADSVNIVWEHLIPIKKDFIFILASVGYTRHLKARDS